VLTRYGASVLEREEKKLGHRRTPSWTAGILL
jgi:hypothetical protein